MSRSASRRGRVTWLALALGLALAALSSGCVSLGRTAQGSMPAEAARAEVKRGAPLALVLERCGAPLESFRQPDGLLLIWRQRRYDYDRLGLDPSRAVSFLGVSAIAAEALSSLRLTLERASLVEDRYVVLFDRADRVTAAAFRAGDPEAPPP